MEKLTKEQAEWLIEKTNEVSDCIIPTENVAACAQGYKIAQDSFKTIIILFTEKDFPEFKVFIDSGETINFTSRYYKGCQTSYGVIMNSGTNDYFFDKEQFKEFVEGCNKILEWMND